jgi:glutathione synthase/RimK-type ligase-like ATP-grasp enzyme
MILLWGVTQDVPLKAAGAALAQAGADVLMLDQFDIARCSARVGNGCGWLSVDGQRHDLAAMRGVYLRPYESARVLRTAGSTDAALAAHAARFDDALLLWTELTDAVVVNRPSAMASNGSKPLQAALITAAGFAVPDTLLTSDRTAAAAFRQRHGRVIYKSMSGVRSKVALADDAVLDRLDTAACPIQLQEFIAGTDLRVHVVGDAVFPCTIQSGATDYRYPGDAADAPLIESCVLPDDVEARALALCRSLGLLFCGIDLRLAVDGRWVCFEVNPSPAFTYYQDATGAPIGAALAGLLMGA